MIGKTIKTIFKIICAILICFVLVWTLSCTHLGPVSDMCLDIKNSILKYVDPVAVVKEAAGNLLDDQLDKLSKDTGVEQSELQRMVQKLNIDGLEPCDLPDNAVVKKTLEKTLGNKEVTIVIYRDPGYITLTYADTSETFTVPEGSQKLITLLSL